MKLFLASFLSVVGSSMWYSVASEVNKPSLARSTLIFTRSNIFLSSSFSSVINGHRQQLCSSVFMFQGNPVHHRKITSATFMKRLSNSNLKRIPIKGINGVNRNSISGVHMDRNKSVLMMTLREFRSEERQVNSRYKNERYNSKERYEGRSNRPSPERGGQNPTRRFSKDFAKNSTYDVRRKGNISREWNPRDKTEEKIKDISSFDDGETEKNEMDETSDQADYIYGISPVLNALHAKRRQMYELFIQDEINPKDRKDRMAVIEIQQLAEAMRIKTQFTDKGKLNSMCGNRPHQGFILKASPLDFISINMLPPVSTEPDGVTSTPLWIALDEVTDPQNMGALLRSAHFFGVDGIVTCSKNSSPITATVSKASSGAAEVLEVHSTSNMMRFLRSCRENGWRIVGTGIGNGAVPMSSLSPNIPTVVVLGNEGYGLRKTVLRECEVVAEVPGFKTQDSTIDSLNVSATGAIIMYAIRSTLGK